MCKYLVLTLPPRANVEAIRSAAPWLDPTPLDNDTLVRALPIGVRPHRATGFICDCGVPVGAEPDDSHGSWPADPVAEADKWATQLRAAAAAAGTAIGVLHHEFRGRPETEGFTRIGRDEVRCSELDAAALLALPADRLLEIVDG